MTDKLSCPSCGSTEFEIRRDTPIPQVELGFYCAGCGNDTGGTKVVLDSRVEQEMIGDYLKEDDQ